MWYFFYHGLNITSQETIAEAICTATVGAALPFLTFGLDGFSRLGDQKGYVVVGFLGSMISVIALVSWEKSEPISSFFVCVLAFLSPKEQECLVSTYTPRIQCTFDYALHEKN